jgi:hypothetical protein
LNINTLGYLHWDSMPIFLFGCLDIWCLELISRLNVKSCLDGQSDELHSYDNMIVIHVRKVLFYFISKCGSPGQKNVFSVSYICLNDN